MPVLLFNFLFEKSKTQLIVHMYKTYDSLSEIISL